LAGLKNAKFGGVCFLVFKQQESAVGKMMGHYGMGGFYERVFKFFKRLILCRKLVDRKKFIETGEGRRRVHITGAPEPADIIWENLCLSPARNYFYRALTWLVMGLLLVGSYFLNALLYDWKKSSVKNTGGNL